MISYTHISLRCIFGLLLFILIIIPVSAQRLEVSDNDRFLVYPDGSPFFWLADTAWELFHRCDRDQIDKYLDKRASQGFNVIQAVALAELDGLRTPNPYDQLPLIDNDPNRPNSAYFDHVDYAIQRANDLGMYIALLPTWGDKVNTESWGVGPEIFDPNTAYNYGRWIGHRYKDYDNIIWIVGGDRNPREQSDDMEIWNKLAQGIVEGVGGYDLTLISFHPQPKENGGSSTWFHNQPWLDFNMHQTGHCANQGTYKHISHDYTLSPIKPVIDGEPLYEDHPNCFNAKELGHSLPRDIRRIMYWNVFAGAFGQTYGCHDIWQMYDLDKEPINQPLRPWHQALDLPMANQAQHLKNLMLSRPFLSRIPDQSMIINSQTEDINYISATRDSNGTYAMIYIPTGGSVTLDLSSLSHEELQQWWFDPRTGHAHMGKVVERSNNVTYEAPTRGLGHDWVLVIDATDVNYERPGTSIISD